MAISDNDGTQFYEIKTISDNDGTEFYPIKEVYDNDGTEFYLIYNANLPVITGTSYGDVGSFSKVATYQWDTADGTSGTIANNTDSKRFKTATRNTHIFTTSSKVDITDYTTMIVKYRCSHASSGYHTSPYFGCLIGLDTSQKPVTSFTELKATQLDKGVKVAGTSVQTKTIDISSLSGNYYPIIVLQSSGAGISTYIDILDWHFE